MGDLAMQPSSSRAAAGTSGGSAGAAVRNGRPPRHEITRDMLDKLA